MSGWASEVVSHHYDNQCEQGEQQDDHLGAVHFRASGGKALRDA
jgi:hypothetical protein